MRRMFLALLITLTLAALAFPLSAQATDLTPLLVPTHLHELENGIWHAENDFILYWDTPPSAQVGLDTHAVHYRVRDWAGREVVPELRIPGNATWLPHLRVPGPGAYTADVWLEGPAGELGPVASAPVRFDDVRPAPATPVAPAGWVAGNAPATVRIEHPSGPLPVSGIRGYAVSVGNPTTGPGPCARADWCAVSETDVKDGIAADTASLGILPEGEHVVRAVAVSGSGMTSTEVRTTVVRVDATLPVLSLRGMPAGWTNGPVRIVAVAGDTISGMAPNGPAGPFVSIAVDGGLPRQEAGDSATVVVSGEGVHRISYFARDTAGNSGEDSPQLATVRIDESPPTAVFAAAQDPADPERIEAAVADSLSGPDPARGSISVRPVGSRQAPASLPTAVADHRLVGHWDSDAFPPGSYEFVATAFDAAGNSVSSTHRQGGGRMVLKNPLKTQTGLVAGFGGRRLLWQRCARKHGERRCRNVATRSFENRPATRAVPVGRGVYFGGRLLTASGSPLGGQAVEIVETFAAGTSLPRRTTVVRTAADGVFVGRLAPGPSRGVEARFAGGPTLSRSESGGTWLNVLAGVRMHASSGSARIGGAPVVFSGRIEDLGAPLPELGRPIELQFRLPGGEWSEFRTVQTDASGRFHYAYAFSDDDSRGIRFQFRAFAPAQDDWPYEPASSRPVFVTGR